MKKTKKSAFILSFSFVLIATLLFSLPSYDKIAYADDQKDKQVSEETITDTVDELLEKTDLTSYEEFIKNLGLSTENYSVKELVKQVLNNDFSYDFKYVVSYVINVFFGNMKNLLVQAVIILITVVLMSILSNLTTGFSRASTKKIVYLACYGTIITVIGVMVGDAVISAGKMINDTGKFCDVVFPTLLSLVTAIGASASAAVYQPMVLIFASYVVKIVNYVVMPAFFISFVFNVVGNMSDDIKLGKIAGFAKSCGEWIVGIAFGVFVTYTTASGITGAGIDSLATKGAKYALSGYVPVIGGYLKDGFDIITAGCIVIKNAIGLVSVVLLLLFAAIPIMKIFATTIVLKLTGAIAEPFGEKKISDMLHNVGKSMTLPLITCVTVVFSILIVIMLIILTCNRGVI